MLPNHQSRFLKQIQKTISRQKGDKDMFHLEYQLIRSSFVSVELIFNASFNATVPESPMLFPVIHVQVFMNFQQMLVKALIKSKHANSRFVSVVLTFNNSPVAIAISFPLFITCVCFKNNYHFLALYWILLFSY